MDLANFLPDQPLQMISSSPGVDQEVLSEKPRSILLALLKQLTTGADLHRITLPVFILERQSLLEKVTDFMSYPDLILHLPKEPSPLKRLLSVVKYYLSTWHLRPSSEGVKKPYNPVLGEFFRCVWDIDCGEDCCTGRSISYYMSEQLSHHPPISGYLYTNPKHGLLIEGNFRPRSKFLGNSAVSLMEGESRIRFVNTSLDESEEYILTNPNVYVRGVILGTTLTELGDTVEVTCPLTGYKARIEFKTKGYFTGCYNALSGTISHETHEGCIDLFQISGLWSDKIFLTPILPLVKSPSAESLTTETLSDVAYSTSNASVSPCPGDKRKSLVQILYIDVNSLHRSYKRVQPSSLPFESRSLWKPVTEALEAKDEDLATKLKADIEEMQRQRGKYLIDNYGNYFNNEDGSKNNSGDLSELNEAVKSLNPNNMNGSGKAETFKSNCIQLIPYSTRYFETTDGINWKFRFPVDNNLESLCQSLMMDSKDEFVANLYSDRSLIEPIKSTQ